MRILIRAATRVAFFMVICLSPFPPYALASGNPGDFDGDGSVNLSDFLAFAAVFGKSSLDEGFDARMDFDDTGSIDLSDFLAFAAVFGTTYEPEPGTPPSDFDSLARDVFARINAHRDELGLRPLDLANEEDDSFIPVRDIVVACKLPDGLREELREPEIDAVRISPWSEGSECGVRVNTYHFLPPDQRLTVENGVWECFSDSRDLRDPNDVSCGGRYSFIGKHVKWLPDEVVYTIVEGPELREQFLSHVPWVEKNLKVKVSEAASPDSANLFLHLGVALPEGCRERHGCSRYEEGETGRSGTIFIAAPDAFFSQTLKHELLHALLPMGHLPEGNYLMSVSPLDPSQTHTLSDLELKLLQLYTHPYLRENMTMDEFRRYLNIEAQ